MYYPRKILLNKIGEYDRIIKMIAIGPDITDVHPTQETLYLSSAPKLYNLLKGILPSIG